jgi:uncharacterized membrane protein YfcA
MFAFEVNEAIPLSKATIFAGAVINVFFLLNQRNEFDMNKSLIDYRLCSYMLPIMMCGTFFGVYLNFIVPPMIIIMLLTGYLMLSIFSIHKKYKILNQRENKRLGTTLTRQVFDGFKRLTRSFSKKKKEKEEEDDVELYEESLDENLKNDNINIRESKTSNQHIEDLTYKLNKKILIDEENISVSDNKSTNDDSMGSKEQAKKLKNKKPFSTMIKENLMYIAILLGSIFIIMTLSLFKEGVFFSDKTEISRCSGLGITVMVIIGSFCFLVSFLAFSFNIKSQRIELKNKLEMPIGIEDQQNKNTEIAVHENDNKMNIDSIFQDKETPEILSDEQIKSNIENEVNKKKVALYKLGSVSFLAGIGAGLLGIGGGMIINPFLIIMNYSPLDATAISSMGVLFTSTISTSEFLIMKAIKLSDLNYFLLFAGIGSLSGVFIIKGLIEKFKRQSILLLIILGIFIFAVIVLPTFGILSIPIQNYFKFGNVCIQ